MRITVKTTALIMIVCLLAGIRGQAQISLSYEKVPIKTVLESIEKQTNYSFFLQKNTVSDSDRITIQVRNVSIQKVLTIFKQQLKVDAELAGNIITLLREQPRISVIKAPKPVVTYLRGIVTNEQDDPLYGTTVYHNRLPFSSATNIDGKFSLPNVKKGDTIAFTNVGYEKIEIVSDGKMNITVKMVSKVGELTDVSVSSGIHKEEIRRATGSISIINNQLVNRGASVNILDRLEGVAAGMLFNKNIQSASLNQSEISIRGRATIFGTASPLIVLDNFPYSGSLNNINPNDVEKVVVLKDAASAGIWGAYSGNGVIVITTKRGKYKQPLKVSASSIITLSDKPDLYYGPFLSSASKIELEQFLFSKNYYRFSEMNSSKPALSPVVELLIKRRDGLISETELNNALDDLRKVDVRSEIERLLYQRSLHQQHGVNFRGGGENNHYYFSVGYDGVKENIVNTSFNRLTVNGSNTFLLLDKKLELSTGMMFTYTRKARNLRAQLGIASPYTKIQDSEGNALAVPFGVRQTYKDTAGKGYLLDWNLRPLDEARLNDNKINSTGYRIDFGMRYKVMKGLTAILMYQYARENTEENDYKSLATYFTRNLINQYTQINSRGEILRPVPLGGISDWSNAISNNHNGRVQLEFAKTWGDHELSSTAGVDIRSTRINTRYDRVYGYDENSRSSKQVDLEHSYPLYHYPFLAVKIPYPYLIPHRFAISNFLSTYGTILYSLKGTYNATLNIRKDESNLFGVRANQKGVPLWSLGLSWNVNKETFYHVDWLPELKIRLTNGFSGNVDLYASAFTAAVRDGENLFGSFTSTITNPPNPSLKWEKSYMLNLGVDFVLKSDRISGSLDGYYRKAVDLIGYSPIDPTTGVGTFRGNTGSIKGKGFELTLKAKVIKGEFNWNSTLNASYSLDKIDTYKEKQGNISFYLNGLVLNPLEGKPLYAIYALKWGGLDPQTGSPIGFINGKESKDYSKIINSVNFDDLIYKGSAVPIYFGGWLNSCNYKGFELSWLITYKLGYYFRRQSVQYFDLVAGLSWGHPDFDLRWKNSGDEAKTSVPSFVYPADFNRDNLYGSSEMLVEKGDHIRLKDVRLSYLITPKIRKQTASKVEIFAYVDNIGILWKANNHGIDPDYINGIPDSRTYSLGLRLGL